MDAKELESFLILKYDTVEKAMMVWLDSDAVLDPKEEQLMAAYAKLYWPNLKLTSIRSTRTG